MSCCDLPSFSRTKVVRARKRHHCVECDRAIEVGGEHEVFAGVYDGQWETYRFCLRCSRARNALIAELALSDGLAFGTLRAELRERIESRFYGRRNQMRALRADRSGSGGETQ